ncbi:MAG: DUF5320 domain-containing protein [Candidatus Omnitrophica bacterium]|nr:DUF5320 domain-containing protein [Candidatus Omnitrophota bacterium]
MPGFDATGPRGQGAMTGGGRGYCVVPVGEAGKQLGAGAFRGRGGGRGWRNCFYATGLPGWIRGKDQLSALKDQAEYLKKELDAIQARVQELESK